jgi:hypothetical protein
MVFVQEKLELIPVVCFCPKVSVMPWREAHAAVVLYSGLVAMFILGNWM